MLSSPPWPAAAAVLVTPIGKGRKALAPRRVGGQSGEGEGGAALFERLVLLFNKVRLHPAAVSYVRAGGEGGHV